MVAEQLEDGQVGTALLGEADAEPSRSPKHSSIMAALDVQRRAEPPGQIGDGGRGDLVLRAAVMG